MKRKQKQRLLSYSVVAAALLIIVAVIVITEQIIENDNNAKETMKAGSGIMPTAADAQIMPTEAAPTDQPPYETEPEEPLEDAGEVFLTELLTLSAGSMVNTVNLAQEVIAGSFYYESINEDIFLRIKEKSFGKDCTVSKDSLRYVRVLHYGFDQNVYVGELIVDKRIAQDMVDIFSELFQAAYPIEKMVLIDNYNADDEQSMSDNNTSCFNFRVIAGSSQLSNHALGLAIDINPLYNPYVRKQGETEIVSPEKGNEFIDRTKDNQYFIKKDDICYKAFVSRGFIWGGEWNTVKDYQHFEKKLDS